jgi:adenine-specific DNA-methyltransferase
VKDEVEILPIEHKYSFGTHAGARRRAVCEYLFVGR